MTPDFGDQLSVSQLRFVVDALLDGAVVFLMSDCSWAAVADPRHAGGVALLDRLLDHEGHPIPVTVADEALSASVIRFDEAVRVLTGKFWPGGLGIKTRPATRLARRISKRLHSGGSGVVVRMSRSIIERQISATARLPITSAALREGGALVTDAAHALDVVVRLVEERAPLGRVIFIVDRRQRVTLRDHSTMIMLDHGVRPLRHGSVDVSDVQRALLSNDGVDWSDAT
jgi:tRNA A37 threonylcarbamoyladenosine synthetase subunit TsaC/SUA5/YrdC